MAYSGRSSDFPGMVSIRKSSGNEGSGFAFGVPFWLWSKTAGRTAAAPWPIACNVLPLESICYNRPRR